MTNEERDALRGRYYIAAHRMQSAVAFQLARGSDSASDKHLRVGVNSALVDSGSLAELLIAKGVITEEEYMRAVAGGMEREADNQVAAAQKYAGGATVDFA